jgi:carbohydrate-selective porin OprB
VLSSRGLRDGPFTRPDESSEYDVSEYDLETSTLRRSRPTKAVEPLKKKYRHRYVSLGALYAAITPTE